MAQKLITKTFSQVILNKILNKELLVSLAIFGLGVFFRLYRFQTVPFGLNHDAALNGMVAIELWHKLPAYIPYYTGWVGETLYHYWLALNFFLFGIDPTILRLASVLIGIATLFVFYLLARLLQNNLAALFSLFFLSISGWHMTISKAGWLAILVPLFQAITLYLLYKALTKNKAILYIATGTTLALTLNTYGAARITPLIVLVIIIFWYFIHRPKLGSLVKNLSLLLMAFLIVIWPLFQFAIHDWQTFTGRAQSLSVANRIKESGSFKPLVDNLKGSLGMLYYRAGGDDFFVDEPLLERIPGCIFFIGFISLLFTILKFESFIIVAWFFLGFLPGILSVPNWNHNFSILVPLYLIIGQGAATVIIFTKRFKKVFLPIRYTVWILTIVICTLTIVDSYHQYLSKNRQEKWGFYPETTVVANFMNENKENYNFYLIDNYPRDALTFLTYRGGDPFQKHYTWFEHKEDLLKVERTNGRGLMFFMTDITQNTLVKRQLLEKFPSSSQYNLMYIDDNINRVASSMVIVPPEK